MTRKHGICMLNPFYFPYPGGTEKHIYEVSKRLAKMGYDVTVLCAPHKSGLPREEIIEGVRVRRIRWATTLYHLPRPLPPPLAINPLQPFDIHELAKECELFHIHNRFVYNLLDVAQIKKIEKRKLAITLHNARPHGIDFATDLLGGLYDDTMGYRIFKSCDAIAANSRDTLETTLPQEFWGKATVVYNGVDEKFFSPHNKGDAVVDNLGLEEKKVVFCVARFVEQKGLKYLLEAMAQVLKKEKDAKLILLGRGPLEGEFKSRVKKLGIGKSVDLVTERISEGDLAQFYAACDVFALPSLWEPFGMVFTEAMATGKPVIGTKIGGIPEVISPDVGFVVPPRDPKTLADRLLELLKDDALRKKMGAAARRRVEKLFTWDHSARGYDEFYKKTL